MVNAVTIMICKFSQTSDGVLHCIAGEKYQTRDFIPKHEGVQIMHTSKYDYYLSYSYTREVWMIRDIARSLMYDEVILEGYYDL